MPPSTCRPHDHLVVYPRLPTSRGSRPQPTWSSRQQQQQRTPSPLLYLVLCPCLRRPSWDPNVTLLLTVELPLPPRSCSLATISPRPHPPPSDVNGREQEHSDLNRSFPAWLVVASRWTGCCHSAAEGVSHPCRLSLFRRSKGKDLRGAARHLVCTVHGILCVLCAQYCAPRRPSFHICLASLPLNAHGPAHVLPSLGSMSLWLSSEPSGCLMTPLDVPACSCGVR